MYLRLVENTNLCLHLHISHLTYCFVAVISVYECSFFAYNTCMPYIAAAYVDTLDLGPWVLAWTSVFMDDCWFFVYREMGNVSFWASSSDRGPACVRLGPFRDILGTIGNLPFFWHNAKSQGNCIWRTKIVHPCWHTLDTSTLISTKPLPHSKQHIKCKQIKCQSLAKTVIYSSDLVGRSM